MLLPQIIHDEERKQIDQAVRQRIRQKDSVPRIPLGNEKFPFGIFVEFLSFLKSKGFEKIDRIYSPKDYSRLRESGGWVWNLLSPYAVENNLKIFFDNLPKVYNDVVSENFPDIREELPLFGDASRVIVLFSVNEEYKEFRDRPKIDIYYLRAEDQDELVIEIHRKEKSKELPDLSWEYLGKDIKINGKKHRLISGSVGVLDFIYDEFPMLNFVYKILERNLERYFSNLREHACTSYKAR